MIHALLAAVFRTSGVSPTASPADRVPFAFAFTYLVVVGGQSVTYWRSRGQTSFHQTVLSASVVIIYFGYVAFTLYANVCEANFTSLVARAAASERRRGASRFLAFVVLAYFLALAAACAPIALSPASAVTIISRCTNLHLFGVPALQFCVAADLLHGRFLRLNDRLRGLHGSAPPPHRPAAPTVALFREHVELRKLVHDVSAYFTFYHALNVVGRIIFLTANLYTILLSFTGKNLTVSVADCTSALYQFVALSLQCVSVNRCLDQANDTVNVAHSLINQKSPLELIREVSDFSLYMFDNPVKFSVGGVFTINNSLITRGAGLTITYLIIAIQLGSL